LSSRTLFSIDGHITPDDVLKSVLLSRERLIFICYNAVFSEKL
jgi:hypothetical protein